jgi:hypothetical protein
MVRQHLVCHDGRRILVPDLGVGCLEGNLAEKVTGAGASVGAGEGVDPDLMGRGEGM